MIVIEINKHPGHYNVDISGSVALAVDQPCKRLVLHGGW